MELVMMTQKIKRTTLAFLGAAFVAVGTYNSVVINSDSFMDSQNVRFVKRLDEINGITTSGRRLANSEGGEWVKLKALPKKQPLKIVQDQVKFASSSTRSESVSDAAPAGEIEAAIKEDLSLELTEVFNAKKYATAPQAGQFSGTLTTTDGVIDSISVSLPNNEGLNISFSELNGNVFEYEYDSQVLSGMMYQMDKSSYMVTLTNGPFEGTRLKFNKKGESDFDIGNNAEELALNDAQNDFGSVYNDDGTQLDVGTFGAEQAPQVDVAQGEMQAEEVSYGFTF
jgi:hypothetical protein